ncbi:MAG: hypothetical protein ACK541_00715 [Burkholderiales bacterium]
MNQWGWSDQKLLLEKLNFPDAIKCRFYKKLTSKIFEGRWLVFSAGNHPGKQN